MQVARSVYPTHSEIAVLLKWKDASMACARLGLNLTHTETSFKLEKQNGNSPVFLGQYLTIDEAIKGIQEYADFNAKPTGVKPASNTISVLVSR